MKKLFYLLGLVILFGACGNTNTTNNSTKEVTAEECGPSISVDSFLIIAENNVGKELTVKGTVDHVCKHGGKRVKIFSTCPSKTIHAEASENIGAFNAELEGSDACFTGIVLETRIDLEYVNEWEAKVKKAVEEEAEEAEMEHKKGVDHHAKLQEIENYRKEIEASEKGYISFYALEANSYKECAAKKKPCCGDKKAEADSVKKPCNSPKEESKTASAPCGKKEESKGCCGDKKDSNKKPCETKS